MSDDNGDQGGSAPRSGAGDPARTQQIPRLTGDENPSATASGSAGGPAKRRPGPAAPAGSRPAKKAAPASKDAPSSAQNGSPSVASPAAKKAPAARSTPARSAPAKSAAKSAPEKTTPAKSTPAASASAATSAEKSAPAKTAPGTSAPAASPPAAAPSTSTPGPSSSASAGGVAPTRPARPQTRREPGSGPLTAGDYARTTTQSASSTAVIPAVRESEPARPAPEPTPAAAAAPGGRQASLRLMRIDPWSVTRLAFVVSVLLMIVSVVAVVIFWVVLDLTGIWDQVNGSITNVLSDNEGSFDLTDYLGLGRLVGLTLVLSAVNVVLITALATIAAHLYNLAAQLLGGIHVTFSDD